LTFLLLRIAGIIAGNKTKMVPLLCTVFTLGLSGGSVLRLQQVAQMLSRAACFAFVTRTGSYRCGYCPFFCRGLRETFPLADGSEKL
jgi:hypothetical protein